MYCCGTKIAKVNDITLLQEIRKVDNLDIHLKLGEYDIELKANGHWKTNFKGIPINDLEEKNQEVERLHAEIDKRDDEIEMLEKKYLAKIARLFIMAQVHCELKSNINDLMKTIKPTVQQLEAYGKEY